MAAEELQALLEAQLAATRRLLDVLEREHEAMAQGRSEALQEILARKQAALEALAGAETRLARHLAARGRGARREDLEALVGESGDPRLHALWRRLREAAAACRRQNAVNGRLAELSLLGVQRLLSVLTGEPTGDTYGAGGKTAPPRGGRSLGAA